MGIQSVLLICGLSSGLIGTIIIAFSISSITRVIKMVIDAQEIFAMSLTQTPTPTIITGLDKQLQKAKKTSGLKILLGLLLLAIGFALQLISILMSALIC